MKNCYFLLLFSFFFLQINAQQKNPFDSRAVKSTSPIKSNSLLSKAEVIDGSKGASNQNFIYKPGSFLKPVISKNNPYLFILPPGEITPTIIYRNDANTNNFISTTPALAAYAFLLDVQSVMSIKNAQQEFHINNIETDNLGMTHVRLQQQYMNTPVHGGEVVLHGNESRMDYLNGNYFPTPEITSVIPSKSIAEAITKVSGTSNKRTRIEDLTPLQKQILKYEAAQVSIIILPILTQKTIQYKLAYQILVRPNFIEVWHYFIDANNLDVLDFYNGTCSANGPRTATANDLNGVSRTINTYEFNGKFYCVDASKAMFNSTSSSFPDNGVGVIETFNANNTSGNSLFNISTTTNSGWNATTTSAHFSAGIAFDYYKTTFNRNSINGSGGTITSIINVTDNGQPMDNAYWNGVAMFYGNGATAFKPLAGSIDVAGHEMTHGVVQATANLEYKSQPGAINESMADIFGCMMDKADWQMGEDITKTSYISTGCLRDLSNPHNGNGNGYQPAKMSEYNNTTQDNGGVHMNSGIVNHAYYLFATAITKPKAEQIYYRALTLYLTKTSKFLDLRYAVVKAATDLHGAASSEVAAAKSAFDQVEIFDPNGNTGGGTGGGTTQTSPNDLPANPGADFILSYDVTGGSTKLYRSSTTGTGFVALTSVDQNRRVTIPDNGAYCLFVDLSGNIRRIDLTGSPFTQTTIYTGGDMENISISKDGKLMAAVSKSIDTSIYIYNFALAQWKKIKLYNPTYSGVNAGGVNYADALEWDNTGQYVIYDAHNVVKNNSGTDLEYWDVGIVKVWDLKTNTWGDGKIEKLFTNLSEGVSIGNPIFSKNSPYIIAFDLIDNSGTTTLYGVFGTNILTNKTTLITSNTKLGFPNYSKLDNKILVDGEDASSNENIYVINLNADKISANGSAVQVIPKGKWGYWYSTGTRSLLSTSKDILVMSVSNVSPAVTATINGTNITATVPSNANLSSLITSFNLSYDATARVSSLDQVSGVTVNNFTNPLTYTITAQDGSTKNYTVTITKSIIGGVASASDVKPNFNVYPNPTGNELNIEFEGEFSYKMMDMLGNSILPLSKLEFNKTTVNMTQMANGVYFLMLNNGNESKVVKVIKE